MAVTGTLGTTGRNLDISWSAVGGAWEYSVYVNGYSKTTTDSTSYRTTLDNAYSSVTVTVYALNGSGTRINTQSATIYRESSPSGTAYSITYRSNDGNNYSRTAYTDTTTSSPKPFWCQYNTWSRPGYSFVGWNTASNGSGASYSPGGTYNIPYSITLYAQWEEDITYYYYRVDIYTASGSGSFELDDQNTYSSLSSSVRISDTWSGYSGYNFVQASAKGSTYYNQSAYVTGLSTSRTSPTVIAIYLRYSLYYYKVAVTVGGSTKTYGPYSSVGSTVYVNSLFNSYASSYVFKSAGSSADSLEYDRYDYIGIGSSIDDQSSAVTITLYCRYAKYPLTLYAYIGDTESEAIASTDPDYTYTDKDNTSEAILVSALISRLSSDLENYYFIRAEYGGSNYTSTGYQITFTSSSSNVVKIRFRKIPRYYVQKVYVDGALADESQRMTAYATPVTVSSLSYFKSYDQDDRYAFSHATSSRAAGTFPASGQIALPADVETTISLYFRIVVIAPGLTVLAHSATAAVFRWTKNGATSGSWYLLYDTQPDLSYASSQRLALNAEGEITVTGLTPGVTYYFAAINRLSSGSSAMSSVITLGGGGGGWGGIDRFDWTYNDYSMIAQGEPVTNIQASAWNDLISKISEVRSATGGAYSPVPYASAGQPITADAFTAMRNAIAALAGAGSVVSISGAGAQCLAAHFAHASNSLKSAVNRAVDYANGY